jgi:hypothetical protein
MASGEWMWARLNREQIRLLMEAEETLGADILLAYRERDQALGQEERIDQSSVRPASLDESQLECLQGLEQQLGAVVVAYQKAGP